MIMIKQWLANFYPMRWYLLVAGGLIGMMSYADYTGWRIMSFNNQQQWSAAGPSGHK